MENLMKYSVTIPEEYLENVSQEDAAIFGLGLMLGPDKLNDEQKEHFASSLMKCAKIGLIAVLDYQRDQV